MANKKNVEASKKNTEKKNKKSNELEQKKPTKKKKLRLHSHLRVNIPLFQSLMMILPSLAKHATAEDVDSSGDTADQVAANYVTEKDVNDDHTNADSSAVTRQEAQASDSDVNPTLSASHAPHGSSSHLVPSHHLSTLSHPQVHYIPSVSMPAISAGSNGQPTHSNVPTAPALPVTFMPEVIKGTYGELHVDANGQYTFVLNPKSSQYILLNQHQQGTDHFLLHLSDGSSVIVQVPVTGKQDTPNISGDLTGVVTEDHNIDSQGLLHANGKIDVIDPDQNESSVTPEVISGKYGSLTIDAGGHWQYQVDNSVANVQALTGATSLHESFTIHTKDGTPQTIDMTIGGNDDNAVIIGVDAGTITEDLTTQVQGQLSVTDSDLGEDHFQASQITSNYGTLSITKDGSWTYDLDNSNTVVQALRLGDKLSETITVLSADGTAHDITVTIQGTNDAPVIGGSSTGSVTEESTLQASGQLTITDVDKNQAHFQVGDLTGTYGTLHLAANGDWTYDLDNTNPKVQALAQGKTATDTIIVHSADGTPHQITITVNGTNDSALIAGTTSGSVTEESKLHASGQLSISDLDSGQDHFQSTDITGAYGSLHIDTDGLWTYDLDNSNSNVQALGDGDKLSETLTVNAADGTPHDIRVWVYGSNDAPVVSAEVVLTNGTEDTSIQLSTTELLANTTDIDHNDLGQLSIANLVSNHGIVIDNKDGTFTFTPEKDYNGDVHFSYDVKDAHGGVTHTGASTTLSARADTAVITGQDTGAITEDHNVGHDSAQSIQIMGSLSVTDPDAGQDHFIATNPMVRHERVISDPFQGELHIDRNGNWDYRVANGNPTMQTLKEGETKDVIYEVRSADGTTHRINITVTGTNDAPVVSSAVTLPSGTEDTNVTLTTAQLLANASDVDHGETAQLSVHNLSADHGTIADNKDGTYTFTPDADYNGTVHFTYDVQDPQGATVATSASMNLAAVDDAAVITGTGGHLLEEDNLYYGYTIKTNGQFQVVDPDGPGQSKFPDGLHHHTGSLGGTLQLYSNGNYFYHIENSAVNHLAKGQEARETFTIHSVDGTSHQVEFVIEGTNDAPFVHGDVTLSSGTEDTAVTLHASDLLAQAGDYDDGETALLSVHNLSADHGTVTDNKDGTYTFKPDADYNGPVHFTYDVQDPQGATVAASASMALAAVNDAAVIIGRSTGGVTEERTLQTSGQLTITDVDSGEAVFQVQTGAASRYGHFSVDATGQWTYSLENSNLEVQHLGVNEHLTDRIAVISADGTVHVVSVTINGTNDAPTITAIPISGTEDRTYNFTATDFGFGDVDTGDHLDHVTITNLPDPAEGSLLLDGHVVIAGQEIAAGDVGKLVFTPAADFQGDVNFKYTVNDGHSDSSEATGILHVANTVDTPTLIATDSTGDEDTAITLHITGTPESGDTIDHYVITGAPTNSTFSAGHGDGHGHWTVTSAELTGLTVTPPKDYHGDFQLKVTATATDGSKTADSATQSLNVHVASVGDGLIATDDKFENYTHFSGGVVHESLDTHGTGNQATVSMWVRVPPGSRSMGLAGFAGGPGEFANEVYVDGAGQIHAYSYTPWGPQYLSGPKIDDGQWHHVVFSVRAAGTKGDAEGQGNSLYLDGNRVARDIWWGTHQNGAMTEFKVGAIHTGVPFTGDMVDVRATTDRGLSASEVRQLYNGNYHGSFEHHIPLAGEFPYNNVGTAATHASTSGTLTPTAVNHDGTQVFDVLANDRDPDGTAIHIDHATDVTDQHGTVLGHIRVIDDHGTDKLQFIPGQGLQHIPIGDRVTAGYSYTIVDGDGEKATAQVHFDVIGGHYSAVQNTAPTATAAAISTKEGVDVQLSETDFGFHDADAGNALNHVTITDLPDPSEGVLKLNGHAVTAGQQIATAELGGLLFSPAPNYAGDAHFQYTVSDGMTDSAKATGTIAVANAQDAPTVTATPIAGTEDTDHTFTATDFGFTDPDPGDVLHHVTISTLPDATQGALSLNGQPVTAGQEIPASEIGNLVFTPTPDFHGDVPFTYTVSDGKADSPEATGTLQIASVIDPATIVTTDASGDEDSAIALQIHATPAGGDAIDHYEITGAPYNSHFSAGHGDGHGHWSVTPAELAGLTVTPPKDYSGDFNLQVKAISTDGSLTGEATQSMAVHVDSVTDKAGVSISGTSTTQGMQTSGNGVVNINDIHAGAPLTELTFEVTIAPHSLVNIKDNVVLELGQIQLWDPTSSGLKVGGGRNAPTGINLADGAEHRITMTWNSASGELVIYDNGRQKAVVPDFHKGGTLNENMHLTLGAEGTGGSYRHYYNGVFTNAVLSDKCISGNQVAAGPLDHQPASSRGDLLFEVRASGCNAVDLTQRNSVADYGVTFDGGGHQVDAFQGTVQPGSTVHLHMQTTTPSDPDDHIAHVYLQGFAKGTVISDGTHTHRITGTQDEVDVNGWNMGQMTAQLPQGTVHNMGILASVVTEGSDGTQATASILRDIILQPNRTTPNAAIGGDDSGKTDEDSTLSGTLTISDADSGDAVFVAGTHHGSNGDLVMDAQGHWTFTPAAAANALADGETANEHFTVQSKDGTLHEIQVTITGTNDQPAVSAAPIAATEDTAHTFSVSDFGFTDPDATDALGHVTITALPDAAQGTLTLNGQPVTAGQDVPAAEIGNLVFTPAPEFSGDVGFKYTVSDGSTDSAEASGTLQVADVNDVPLTTAGTIAINEDTPHTFSAGDFDYYDEEGDALDHVTIQHIPDVAQGTLTFDGNSVSDGQQIVAADLSKLVFTPAPDYNGNAQFSYTVSDGTSVSTPATTTFAIAGVADAPTAQATPLTATEDQPYTFTATNFGFADADAGDTLDHITITGLPDAAEGTLLLDGHAVTAGQKIATADIGKLVFTPAADFHGDVNFKYTVSDGTSDSAEANGTIHVENVVDAPTVSDGGASGDEDSAIALHLSATASGDTIAQYVITGVPAGATLSAGHDDGHGQWTIPAREVGNVTITPPKDFSGAIHLNAVATASDGSHTADSTAHAMTVTVNPVADMPNVDTFEAHGPIGASAPPSMVKTITADQGLVDAFHANDDDMGLAILQFKNATLDDLLGIKINGQPIQLSMHDLKQYCDPRHDGILNVIYDSGAGKGLGLNRIKTGDVIEFTFKDGLPADTGIVARITPSGQEMMNYIGWVKDLPELLHNTPELPVFDHLDPQVGPPHEDGGLDLHLAVSSPDASETLEVVISGLPAGTTLNHGVKQSDGSWRVDAADAGALRATFPDSFHGGVDLQVKAVSHDGTSTTESNPVSRHIEVSSVTDRAEVTAGDISTDEHHGDWQDLPLTVAAHDSTDPVTAVTISGLSSEFELRLAPGATGTAPHKNADGTWTIDPQTASQLQVHTDDHDGASSIYEVKVTTTGPDGTTEEITQSGNVTIHAVIDNQFTLAPSLSPSGADSKVEVNFGQVQTVGELFEYHEVDTDEGGKLLITVPHGMQLIQPGGIVSYANFAALGQPGFDTFEVPISEMNKAVIGWGSVEPTGTEIHISVEQREGSGTSAAITTQEFTFTGAINTNPVAAPQVISGTEDMAHTFGVGDFGFKDGDHGDTLHHVTITGLPDAAEGTLTLDGNAIAAGQAIAATDVDKLVFTPASDFHGDVTFKYTVSDGKSDSAEATGTLAIASANDAAVIGGTDTGSVTEDVDATHGNTSPGLTPVSNGLEVSGQLTITDPEAGEAHFIARDSAEAHGNFILTDDGFWSYTVDNSSPAIQALGAGEHITDAIQVVSADGTTHTIHVTINGTNDVPIVSAATTLSDGTENTDVTIQALDLLTHLLANATDIDHNDVDQLMVVHVRADHGTITNNNDGTFTFHPEPNYSGVVTFSYDVHDAHSGSTSASATMTLAAVNDAPTVTQSPIAATEEIAYTFSATDFGFTDADATDSLDHITLTALPDPAEGTLLLDGHAVTAGQEIAAADIGKLLFTPASDFHGDVGFKYTVSDGTTDSTEANGTIQVANTVDAPTETVQDASGTEDHAIALAIGGTAEAGDTITQYVITGVPDGAHLSAGHNDGHGQWTVAGAAIGGLKITPPPNFSGDLQLHAVATASDGTHTADSTSHALTVHVNPDPDVPNIDSFDVNGSSSLGTAAGPVSMTQVVTVDAAMHAALSQTFSSPRFTTHDSRSVLKLEGATWHDVESMTIDGHPVNVPFVAGALARFDPHCVVIPQTGVFAMFPVFGLGEGKQIEITFKPGTDPGASIVATALPNTDEVIAKWQAGQVSFDHLEVSVPLFTSLQTPGHSPQAIGIHEDGDLDLHFAVSSPDSSESLELMISGLPAGTTLSHGVRQSNGSWLVDSAYLSDLKANLPNGFHGSLDLEVKAISHDGTATAESAPIIRHIEVASVTDQAVLTTGDVIVDEHQTGWHDLPITIAESDSQDPVTAVTITNLASGFELRLAPGTTGSAPHKNADGSWTIDPQTATHLQVHTNDHDGETSLYQVQVTTTGPDGVTAETTHSGHVTLNAVIDNQVTLDSSLSATGTGAVVDVDLSSHGQLRSIGDLFSYHELDSDENTTLYIRVPNSVSIFRAGGMATYGTVDHTHRDSRGVVTDNDPGFTTYVVSAFDMGKALVMSGGAPLSGFEIHVLVDHGEGTGVTGANAFENYNFTGASVDEFNFIPTVTPHVISGSEDTPHTFGVSDFGFADGNQSDTLDHVTITGLPDPAEGTLTLDGNAVAAGQTITAADIGKLVFTPAPNFHGGVNFKYTVSDGKDDSPEATGTIDVTSGNDAAVIGGTDTGSVTEDTALTASGQLTISDADAGEAVFQTQTGASTRYGHFSVDAAGQWIYSLESSNQAVQSLGVNEHLADRISVTSADGTVHVVSVTINGTNDVPTVSASPIGGTEDTDHTFSVSDFGFHDVDTNDTLDHVTFSALPAVTEGELLLNGHSVSKGDEISKAEIEAGNLVFKPAANYNGDVHFKYTVNDGHVDSSEATGVIQVNATSGAVQYDEPDMLNDGDTFDYEVDLVMQDGHDHTGGDHADHLHHVALDDVVLVIPDSQHQAVSPPPVTGAAAYLDALGIVPPPSANKATEHQLPADMDIVMAKAEQLDFDHDGNAHVDLSDALEHQGYEHKQQDHDDTKHHHQVDDLSDIDPNS